MNEFTPAELRAIERAGNAALERTRGFIRAEHRDALMGTPKPLTQRTAHPPCAAREGGTVSTVLHADVNGRVFFTEPIDRPAIKNESTRGSLTTLVRLLTIGVALLTPADVLLVVLALAKYSV